LSAVEAAAMTARRRARRRWWATKVRQFARHVTARVSPAERASLDAWLTPPQAAVFDGMHLADRRHGLGAVASLRAMGVTDRDVLVAGLLHDAGKGATGLWPRVAWSLGEAWGPWIWRVAGRLPGMSRARGRLGDHAARSAALAAAAGCSSRTVELIRNQEAPTDTEFGELLRIADEAN
jgi:hypothetical protein